MSGRLPAFSPPPSFLLSLGSSLLLLGLRPRIRPVLKWLYPHSPSAATEALASDIERDSRDFGAEHVIMSGGKLPPPSSANELLDARLGNYGGPVLVVQGVLDPLNDAELRAEQFGNVREGVEVVRVQAGHCVMDERPGVVADELGRWIEEEVEKSPPME